MKRNLFTLILALLCLGGFAQTITPELAEEMNRRSDDEKIDIVIIMKQQCDNELLNHRAAHFTTRAERRDFVVNELKQHAEATQHELQRSLVEMEGQNMVANVKVLWIANAISLSATKTAILDLAQRADISLIGYDKLEQAIPNSPQSQKNVDSQARAIAEHVTHVNADDAWALGYTGQGVLVAIVDSGVNYNHIDLADHLWDGGTQFPHHGYDIFNNDDDPMDDMEHGTHVAGIICGDGTAGQQTGIAPDATLMCLKVTNASGASAPTHLTGGMQWALEHGADLINVSMGYTGEYYSEMVLLRNACVNMLSAGVVTTCGAGNEGNYQSTYPIPYNVRYPGSCPPPYLDPDQQANPGGLSSVISVGCVNTSDVPSSFTSHGPSTWTATSFGDYPYNPGIGLIRPDVCAPGDWVLSLDYYTTDDYFSMGGTSQATPIVTGTIALMLSKNPNLTPAQICQIVEETAVPLSRTKSNITGCGRVDALAAVNAVGGSVQNYTISVSANPSNGGTVTGGGAYYQGDNCTVSASPNSNFTFTNWTENGNVVSTNASYSFTVNGNRTLVANFTAIPQNYTISVSANPSNGGTVTGGGTYQQGQSCTVSATPNSNFTFTNWTENGNVVSTNASYSFTVNGNRTLVANFTAIPQNYIVSVSANPSNGGTVSGGGTYQQGQSCTVSATPNSNFTFTNWTENGSVVSTNASYSFAVNSNRTLVANFTAIPQNYTISVSANPSNGGTVSGGGTYQQGQSCTVSATANEGFNFLNWTESGNIVSSNESYSFSVNNNRILVANFELQAFEITAVAEPEEGATVTGAGTYDYGEQVTLSVETFTDYVFEHWSEDGEIVSTEPVYTFTATANRHLVANLLYTEGLNESESNFTVYPNPASESLTIEAEGEVAIIDETGRTVKTLNVNGKKTIDLKDFSRGVYFIKVEGAVKKVFVE